MKEKTSFVREKILSAAYQLLKTSGIQKLAQPQIARDSGIPQGHITYYFPKRADLLIAVAERSLHSIAEFVLKRAAETGAGFEPKTVIPLLAELLKDRTRTRTLVGLLVESDENPELREKLQERVEAMLQLIAAGLGKETDDPAVHLAHATCLGLAIQHYLADEAPGSKNSKTDVTRCLKWVVEQKLFVPKKRKSKS